MINKMRGVLKDLWHLLLWYRIKKLCFFHGNDVLARTKKYGYLFRSCLAANIELVFFDTEKNHFYLKCPSNVIVKTNEYYTIFLEIFVHKLYALPPEIVTKYYVFDVGMNKGYTSLYYAADVNCEGVFGFELDSNTYNFAQENFKLNPWIASKIHTYNFGLLDENKEVDIYYVEGEDGIATVDSVFVDSYWSENRKANSLSKKEMVRQASTVFSELFIGCNKDYLKILKIDCEGAEYAIFADLNRAALLNEFDVIIGGCHLGMENLEKYLGSFICRSILEESPKVKQFCYVNKRIM